MAGAGLALAQGGAQQGGAQQGGNTLNIPPAPPKPQPNMQYGNTARAALIAEGLSDAAQGNARLYISEDKAINVKVNLIQDASPYDLAPTMANLTYMLASLYSLTEKPNSDIVLKVYDTSHNLIIDAKFNTAKNAFDYFNVPEGTAPPQQQPGMRQPGMGRQPGYGGQYPMQ
jgi:hypothetical protein